MTARPSTRSQNGNGSPSSNSTSGGGGSRNDGASAGPTTSGMARSVNSKPARAWPNTATVVWPASAPAARAVAMSCDIERPRRRTATSMVTSPAGIMAANTVVCVRSRCSGSPSSRVIAAAARAAIVPPCGTVGQFQHGSTSTW